jgi:hypothetical protein
MAEGEGMNRSGAGTAMGDNAFQFHLEEYKSVRHEIKERIEAIRALEREVMLGSFAIYSWLAVSTTENLLFLSVIASWLPVALVLVANWRRVDERQQILALAQYIKEMESKMGSQSLKGWETWWNEYRDTFYGSQKDRSRGYWINIEDYGLYASITISFLFTVVILAKMATS